MSPSAYRLLMDGIIWHPELYNILYENTAFSLTLGEAIISMMQSWETMGLQTIHPQYSLFQKPPIGDTLNVFNRQVHSLCIQKVHTNYTGCKKMRSMFQTKQNTYALANSGILKVLPMKGAQDQIPEPHSYDCWNRTFMSRFISHGFSCVCTTETAKSIPDFCISSSGWMPF